MLCAMVNAQGGVTGPYEVDEHTVALYHCDTGSGTTLIDETGVYDGIFRSADNPIWTTDSMFGPHALEFDGIGDNVSQPALLETIPQEGTIELWFKPSVDIGTEHLEVWLTFKIPSQYNSCHMGWSDYDSRLHLQMNVLGTKHFAYSNKRIWKAGTWYHVAVTWGSRGMEIWVNGVLEGTNPNTFIPITGTDAYDFSIGADHNSNYGFAGIIDEIRVSNIQRVFVLAEEQDTDGDLMPDDWETENGLDPLNAMDGNEDFDHDKLVNLNEYVWGTDPNNRDTDGDHKGDWWEIRWGHDPLDPHQ